jgi:hypothetical protein
MSVNSAEAAAGDVIPRISPPPGPYWNQWTVPPGMCTREPGGMMRTSMPSAPKLTCPARTKNASSQGWLCQSGPAPSGPAWWKISIIAVLEWASNALLGAAIAESEGPAVRLGNGGFSRSLAL